ncbi:hypothetical protein [Halorussus lipolyticus]|uniref:hypothetical protein n=1 Tax=Halorussus lipolyticus TaxID=3034024 RepID=UPI0023E8219E|nr:hypothetical protein [Halorussus sp. DT80]
MVSFECATCGARVSEEVALLEDETRLCEDGYSGEGRREYLPEGFYVVGAESHIYPGVGGDYLLHPTDVLTMDRMEAVPIEEYTDFFGCCGLRGKVPNTFCPNGHRFATEISDHCSRVVQIHRDRVEVR